MASEHSKENNDPFFRGQEIPEENEGIALFRNSGNNLHIDRASNPRRLESP